MKCNIKKVSEISLKSKLLLMTSLLTIIAILVVSSIFYDKLYDQTTQLLQQQALAVAKSAAMLIDGDEFERLSLSLDANDKYYKESLSTLKRLNANIGQGMLYAIVDQDPNHYTYVIDGSGTVGIGYKQQKTDFAKEAAKALDTGKSYFCEPYHVKTFKKQYISAFVPLFNSQNEVVGIVEYDYEGSEVTATIREMNVHIIAATVLLISLILIINYLILKRLFRPLEKLVKSIDVIAKGDLTIELAHRDNDEIGQINGALNETVFNIRSILEKIKESSKKVTIASKSILVSSKDATEVYEELAVSTSKILDTTKQQLCGSRILGENLEDLQKEIEIIHQQVDFNEKEFTQICEVTHDGFKVIDEAEGQIKGIENRLAIVNQAISNLSHYMNTMHEMLMVVLQISEQTTLLGLNVEKENYQDDKEKSKSVFDNVEQLMSQSQTAMNEIREIINFIDNQIGFVANEIKESTHLLSTGLEATSKSKVFLLSITNENKGLSQQMGQLHTRIEETRDKVSHIKESVQDIEEVSTFIDANTMSLLAITQEQVATSEEFKAMAELLREQAKLLDDSISKFTV